MKQKTLLLGLGFLSAFAMQAQSPYTGSATPTEAASFYMYQVESGKWLQNNQRVLTDWTTRAQLDKDGFDVELIPIEGVTNGYRINPKNNGNNSLNASNFYTDTGDAQTTWIIEPKDMEGVSNAYTVKAPDNQLLGSSDGDLAYSTTNTTWQFVTREERTAKMTTDVANGEVDATWLIPGHDISRVDSRNSLWVHKWQSNAGNVAIEGIQSNSAQEAWHNNRGYVRYITLNNIPNGTYQFTLQGYYRDYDVADAAFQQRIIDGTPIQRAHYFAGTADGLIMPISQDASDVQVDNRYTYHAGNVWVPDALSNATNVFNDGKYLNPWLTTVVTDNTLTVGVYMPESAYHDWFVYDNFQLKYTSTDTSAYSDTALKAEMDALGYSDGFGNLPSTAAISKAYDDAHDASIDGSATDMRVAQMEFYYLAAFATTDDVNNFLETLELAEAEDADTSSAASLFYNATNDFSAALKEVRYARRRANADTQEDVFEGQTPAAGDFYLYNVGQEQFLCGGSDWGAHAALGFPGIRLTLEAENADELIFHIKSNLDNGDNIYMNYRGYMDCGKSGAWKFIPVDGEEGVYNIVQNDYQDAYVAYNPYAAVDAGHDDETTVGTENRGGFDPTDPDQQWKLVTRAQRDALLEAASLENPADATLAINSPGFNKKERANDVWTRTNSEVWDYDANHSDCIMESWNKENSDVYQELSGLKPGVYTVSVQGFYRNGRTNSENLGQENELKGQPDLPVIQNAILYANDAEALLPNIVEGSMKAPGEGVNTYSTEGTLYNIPDNGDQAAVFFRTGLYRQHTTVSLAEGATLKLGVKKEQKGSEQDWVVIDNFRLTYWGNETTVEAVEDYITTGIVPTFEQAVPEYEGDGFIYNLQGIRVNNPQHGIYIQNGKKFVVK